VLKFLQDGLGLLNLTDEVRGSLGHQILGESLQRLPR
jgi:hypothetical protein